MTTHWAFLDRLKKLNNINVTEQHFTKNKKISTSAGISAGIDMSLAFITDIADEKTAGDVQLAAEYYPAQKIYDNDKHYLPHYAQ